MDSAVELLRWQFGVVHRLIDTWSSEARLPLTRYAESVVLEDVMVNGLLGGCAPLALSTWRGRTGLKPLPPVAQCWGKQTGWGDSVVIDRAQLRTYARAVYATTDSYLSGSAPGEDRLTVHVLTALLLSLSARHE